MRVEKTKASKFTGIAIFALTMPIFIGLPCPCMAQTSSSTTTTNNADGTSSTHSGAQYETTNTTGSQSTEDTMLTPAAPPGQTWTTLGQTQNSGSVSGPSLPATTTTSLSGVPYYAGGTLGISDGPLNLSATLGVSGTIRGWLPPTNLDSFVYNSGYDDTIYGDEGDYGPPPYWNFNTIGSGMGASDTFLTTGHASPLPSSWGYTIPDFPDLF